MLILTIRSDKPVAELGLFNSQIQLDYYSWPAHRELSDTIHLRLKDLLSKNGKQLPDIRGIAVYQGPGSFTGLRIGISVANALADSLDIPIVAASGQAWLEASLARLEAGQNDHLILPEYGSPPHITKPKH